MDSSNLFLNSFGRLRSGWRFLIFLFAFFIASTVLGAFTAVALARLPFGLGGKSLAFHIVVNLTSFLIAALIGWLCGKYLENLPFRALGLSVSNRWLKHLILGLICGTLSIFLAAGIGVLFGGLSFRANEAMGGSAILVTLVASLAIFIVGAANEEAIFRGYMMQTFARANLAWFAVVFTSVFFAAVHLNNPNSSAISTLNTGLAGIVFGAAYMKTRTLWFPFGLHLTWNWVQGAFLGITVSGLKELTTAPLLQASDNGPKWLTGGEYGIEGGVACTIALVATAVFIWFAPFLKPTDEMLALTDKENPAHALI